MTDQPKRGKRVQIYLPADLLERWGQTPRYERSATVAEALRAWWKTTPETTPNQKMKRGVSQDKPRSDGE